MEKDTNEAAHTNKVKYIIGAAAVTLATLGAGIALKLNHEEKSEVDHSVPTMEGDALHTTNGEAASFDADSFELGDGTKVSVKGISEKAGPDDHEK